MSDFESSAFLFILEGCAETFIESRYRFFAMRMCMHKDTIRVKWPLGIVLSGKQHPNLQDLGKLLLLEDDPNLQVPG